MMKRIGLFATAISALTLASSAQAAFVVSVENSGVQNSTSTFSNSGVGSFNGLSTTGAQGSTATSNFSGSYGSSGINGSYTGASVYAADQFGGAGGTGNYLVARDNNAAASYTISFSQSLNYFGLWVSALDAGNQLSFYNGSTLVYSYAASDLISAINNFSDGSSYYGNPNGGGDTAQAFAFVNFYDQGGGTFNSITVSENLANSGFESDNHTVGTVTAMSGRIIAGSVPEPATWAMLILGFGVIGWAMRRNAKTGALQLR